MPNEHPATQEYLRTKELIRRLPLDPEKVVHSLGFAARTGYARKRLLARIEELELQLKAAAWLMLGDKVFFSDIVQRTGLPTRIVKTLSVEFHQQKREYVLESVRQVNPPHHALDSWIEQLTIDRDEKMRAAGMKPTATIS